ncbi:MAG: RHS repeat domain-containing protein, partial [Chitinophagaceae bacterium]
MNSANSGVVQVPQITGSEQAQPLVAPEQIIQKDGYLYIYVSNESAQKVFFDNLVIHHAHGPLLEETNYYPDGLAMSGISDQAMLEPGSRFKYQGKELDTALAVDLYDFGARYYDEQIGRFGQLDPAGQFASGYMGMGDDWVTGTDQDGEYFGLDDLAAGLIGGIYNLTSNLIQGNVHNIGQGFGYFGLGFGAGVAALYPEFGGWMVSGALVGGGNALLQGKSWSEVGQSAGIGMISGVAGGAVGSEVAGAVGGLFSNIASPVLRNLIGGTVGGYAGEFAGGFAASAASGSSLRQAVAEGFKGGNIGGIVGTAAGIGMGYVEAKQYDINPWTGRLNAAKEELEPLSGKVGLQGLN